MSYVQDNIRIAIVKFAIVFFGPVCNLEFLKKKSYNHNTYNDNYQYTNIDLFMLFFKCGLSIVQSRS